MQIKDLTTPFSYVTTDVMPWCSTGGVDSKVSYGDLRTAISNYATAQNPVTNNARIFDCSYRLNGDYAAGDMIAGVALTGTDGSLLSSQQVVLRYNDTNKQNNGLWQIQPTGAAVRYSKANTGGLLMYSVAMPNAGTYKGKWYKCTNYAPNIGTDAIEYAEIFTPTQSLNTTDSPTFSNATIGGHNIDSELDTLNGRVNQGVKTTDIPTFAGVVVDGIGIDSNAGNIYITYGLDKGLVIDEFKNLSDKQNRVANVTDTEIGYLDGVTSPIQTQLGELYNAIPTKANIASPAFTGYVEAPNLRISPTPYGSYNPTYDLLFESYHSTPIETSSGTYVKGKLYGRNSFTFDNTLGITKLGTVETTGLATLDTAKIGDVAGGNYTEFEADGTLVGKGDATCYMDVIIPMFLRGVPSEPEAIAFPLNGIGLQPRFRVDDILTLQNAEAPHDWEEGSAIEIHMHFSNGSQDATDRYIKFTLEYAIANMVANGNTNTQFVRGTQDVEILIPANTPAYTHLYATLKVIDATAMTGIKIGAGFVGSIKRITAVGTAPSVNPYVLNLGIHYKANTLGSRTTTSK